MSAARGALPLLFLFILFATHCTFAAAANLQLVTNGTAAADIILPDNPTASESFAAKELQSYLANISGAQLAIRPATHTPIQNAVLLGTDATSSQIRKLGISFPANPGGEDYVIVTSGTSLVIGGGRPRGTLYGVYAFLEDTLGCRWYTPDCTKIPPQKTIELPPLRIADTPAFEYREPFYTEGWDHSWAAQNRVNGHSTHLEEMRGGSIGYYPHAHTFYKIVPPEKYSASHPEYFSEINGKRKWDDAQLCMTNPDVTSITAQTVIQWAHDEKWAQLFCVEQNDCGNWCTCANCRKIADEEGAQSGVLMRYLNAVGERLEKAEPQAKILTLAYQWTEAPPRITAPRANVRVQLAPINNCFGHPIDSCDINKASYANLQNWSRLTQNLYIWHYGRNLACYLLPYPDFDELAGSLRAYQRLGVKGVFIEGAYGSVGGSELADMRCWVLAKLLWQPQRDHWSLMQEFATAYYGPAGPPIIQYLHLLHDKIRQDNIHLKVYEAPEKAAYLTTDVLTRAESLFQQAEDSVTSNPQFLARVQKARLAIEYARLVKSTDDAERKKYAHIVAEKIERFKIGEIREAKSAKEYADQLSK